MSFGLTLHAFNDLATFQSGLELFIVQPGVEPEDVVTAQAAYSLIETARIDPFYSRALRQMFLESTRNNPRIAEVFLRALALKPSSVPKHTQRFATHFDPSLFLKDRTGSAQLIVGVNASQGPSNSSRRAATSSVDEADKSPQGKTQDVDAYVEIFSLAEALNLPMRRKANMFMVVRLKDGSIVMRAGAGSHLPMKGKDDRVASGWYEIKGGTVTLHIDDRESGISDVEMDRLIRSRIFFETIRGDLITIEFKTLHPAPANMEERLRILRTANKNERIYIPKDRAELFEAVRTFEIFREAIKGVLVRMTDGEFELRMVGNEEGTHHSLVLLGEKVVWEGFVMGIPEKNFLSFQDEELYGLPLSSKTKIFLRKKFGDFGIEP